MTNTRLILLSVATALSSALAIAQTPAQMLKEVEREARRTDSAFQAFSATRGERFFRTPHGGEWSCASCQEHDEVPTPTWKLPAVKSKANCGACHTRAEQGDFSEASLRVPK